MKQIQGSANSERQFSPVQILTSVFHSKLRSLAITLNRYGLRAIPALQYSTTPFPLLPCNRQIAIKLGLLRLTENADPSVMCLNDLASD
jgi:hypothetical protein